MALRLRYVGARPYCEITIGKHQVLGFSRGMIRDDVPQDLIRNKIMPMIENGATAWEVTGSDDNKAKQMLRTVRKPSKPTVKKAVNKVVEVVKEVTPRSPMRKRDVGLEAPLPVGFTASMTRAQMMSWCSANGIKVNNRSTKASMTAQARDRVTGESE